jgi:hypothetical protein
VVYDGPVTDQTLRRVIALMATLLVVVVAAGLLVVLSRGGSGGSTPPPGSGAAIASTGPSPSTSPPASAVASASLSLSAPPSSSPTPTPVPAATLTVVGLQLDPTTDTAGKDRIITFTTDGPGTMSVHLATETGGTTHMCFLAGTKALGCKDWKSGTFNGKTTQAHTNWKVTVRGKGSATPVVDVTTTFQAVAPAVMIANARFDGTDAPTLNGIKVRFVPRSDGNARLVAEWGGHPFDYEIDTFDETTATAGPTYHAQEAATGVDQQTPVTAGDTWSLVLKNSEAGFGTTPMTATISWPPGDIVGP